MAIILLYSSCESLEWVTKWFLQVLTCDLASNTMFQTATFPSIFAIFIFLVLEFINVHNIVCNYRETWNYITAATVYRGTERHHGKFYGDRSNHCYWNMGCWLRSYAILDFYIFEILNASMIYRVKTCVTKPNFVAIGLGNRCLDMAIFRFFKMAAVRHLWVVIRVLGRPMKSTWWSLSSCKIWLEWIQ